MANAIICYTHNVCSTAMAMYAGRMPEVFQPIGEQFDPYRLPDYSLTPETAAPWIAETLEDLYCRRTSETWMWPEIARFRGRPTLPSVEEKKHIVFKWRCTDPSWVGTHLIRDVLERHHVKPLVIVRRSAAEQAIKILLGRKVYNAQHPQFAAAKLSPDEYRAYMDDQTAISVTFTDAELKEARGLAVSLSAQTRTLIKNVQYYFPAYHRPLLLIAEDVFRPLIDRDRHFRVIQKLLGDVTPLAPSVEIRMRKAGLDLAHCANASELLASQRVREIESEYADVLATCDIIQFPPEDAT